MGLLSTDWLWWRVLTTCLLTTRIHPYAQTKIFVYIILFFKLLHSGLNTVCNKIIDSLSIKVILKSTGLSYLIYRLLKKTILKAGFLKNIPKLISPYGFLPFQKSLLGGHAYTTEPFRNYSS